MAAQFRRVVTSREFHFSDHFPHNPLFPANIMMNMDYPNLPLFHRPRMTFNLAVHPRNRQRSNIFTDPAPSLAPRDPSGGAQVRVIRNQQVASPHLLMTLSEIENLFVRQLPNMGAGYITRLVFDFQAESVCLFYGDEVVAAISSRVFAEQQMIEIAFCAVLSDFQARGFGRLSMSFLKSVVQARGFRDILTCADSDAVPYFKNQGFDSEGWVGYIKDYNGVTLAHCRVHPEIAYLNFSETNLERQLE
jgi:histone acetyltransferase